MTKTFCISFSMPALLVSYDGNNNVSNSRALSPLEFLHSDDDTETRLLYFSAEHCKPCKAFRPIVDIAAAKRKIPVFSVDIDNNPLLASHFGIRSLPTIIFLKQGMYTCLSGNCDPRKLAQFLG